MTAKTKLDLREFAVLSFATLIIAAAVFFFLIPSRTSVSSISGLAIVLTNFVPLPVSAITMILNVVLLIIGFFTCGNEFGEFNWYITFDEIFFYNTTNNDTEINQSNDTIFVNYQRVIYSKAKISPNLGLIISTNDYFYEIEKIFFQKLYDKGVCYTSYISGYKFDIIYCLTSMIESNELESFPSLHFKNFIFNYDFELTYKDLFFEQGKYTFFSIIRQSTFRNEENDFDIGSKWEFGLPFLKKYFLTFDYDNRLIGFYKQTNQNKNVYNVGSENTGAKVMTIIILCILFAMICFLCSRRIFKKRRSFNDDKDSFAIKKPYIASELLNYYEK